MSNTEWTVANYEKEKVEYKTGIVKLNVECVSRYIKISGTRLREQYLTNVLQIIVSS